ncbi:MAG: hypothetical protein COW00_16535 [Bdellovibrio sp. CG12_big_fil_rev_8_21_14_0_65_39_13]|nr:MAG: hypothetical protein COW78_09825 [Bdellovibrio sp. CG22_combo_CG10-13_8_21_14_all_39_27]PIQ58215.1 MAG: hypothetical protein COW00_16535 [Bdellovibrio sp. CG12_big_fil_rev_8_21_14_0_65_39_13]PIR36625.1 MAG: hypothetical protein COV37_02050 [Bdellovibrio sp. CG11_big_fil_rev_8_21_14_0_20_39_38]
MSVAQLVKGCPLFHEIYDEEIEEIIKDCFVASFKPGDLIIKQGDTSSDICVILTGEAEVVVHKGTSKFSIVKLGRGDLFGELVLINETQRTADIVAIEETDILVMTYENFFSHFSTKPQVFALMILNVTRLITKRLKASNLKIEELAQQLNQEKAA